MQKQLIGQVAKDEQQPSMAFPGGSGFLCGQQFMSMEDDMFDMSADLDAAAEPAVVGSTATDKTSKKTRMARPTCMGSALCGRKYQICGPSRQVTISRDWKAIAPRSGILGRGELPRNTGGDSGARQ